MRALIRQAASARRAQNGPHYAPVAAFQKLKIEALSGRARFVAPFRQLAQKVGKRRFAVAGGLPFRFGFFKLHDIFNATVKKRPAFFIAVAFIAEPYKPRRAQNPA